MIAAAVDIGTNSVRLLVAAAGEGELVERTRRVVVTGLGRGVDAGGELAEGPMAATLEVLAGYAAAVAAADRSRAVATSAVRDAANREHFLDRAADALGIRPEVISGEEEASLSFSGVTTGLVARAPYLVIDPGGGSTEFVYGTAAPEFRCSVDIGSVRLTERALPQRPAPGEAVCAAAALVDGFFEQVALPGPPGTIVGVGGTYTSLAAIALDLAAHDRQAVHGTALTCEDLAGLVERLAGLTVEETAAIPSLDPARAPVLLAGAVVAERALRRVGGEEIIVSEADLLDGMALGLV
jgi:exopolyphosphatase/guanosine-5'-triphosphate,3'-diphosphate pyrophosphatase